MAEESASPPLPGSSIYHYFTEGFQRLPKARVGLGDYGGVLGFGFRVGSNRVRGIRVTELGLRFRVRAISWNSPRVVLFFSTNCDSVIMLE